MIDAEAEAQLQAIRLKIRNGIEPTEDEMREVILAARAGRRSAADGQAKRRKAPPVPITVTQLFPR
jgi:hypothetical protein